MPGDIGVSVSTASTQVLAADPSRSEAVIVNDSASQVVYLSLGSAASVGAGVRLNPRGDRFTTSTRLSINAVATAAGARVVGGWV